MHKKKGEIKGRVGGGQRGNRKQTGHVWIQTASHNIADDGGDAEEPRGTNEKAPKRCKNSLSAQISQLRKNKTKQIRKVHPPLQTQAPLFRECWNVQPLMRSWGQWHHTQWGVGSAHWDDHILISLSHQLLAGCKKVVFFLGWLQTAG